MIFAQRLTGLISVVREQQQEPREPQIHVVKSFLAAFSISTVMPFAAKPSSRKASHAILSCGGILPCARPFSSIAEALRNHGLPFIGGSVKSCSKGRAWPKKVEPRITISVLILPACSHQV